MKKHNVVQTNESALRRLTLEAERKRTLSLHTSATVSIESLIDRYDFHSMLTDYHANFTVTKAFDQIISLLEIVVKEGELNLLDTAQVWPLIFLFNHLVLTTI